MPPSGRCTISGFYRCFMQGRLAPASRNMFTPLSAVFTVAAWKGVTSIPQPIASGTHRCFMEGGVVLASTADRHQLCRCFMDGLCTRSVRPR